MATMQSAWGRVGTALASCAVLLALFNPVETWAQQVARDEYVRVTLVPENLEAVYPRGLPDGVSHWIFGDERIVVQVVLTNNTSRSLSIPRTPQEWFDSARIELITREDVRSRLSEQARGLRVPTRLLSRYFTGKGSRAADTVELPPMSSERVRLAVQTETLSLPTGLYALRVSLDEERLPAFAKGPRNSTVAERVVGVRNLESREDYLNYYVHMAIWAARTDRNFPSARNWIQQLLGLNPSSGVARSLLGDVAQAEGRCAEAVTNWQRAATVLATEADPEVVAVDSRAREQSVARFNSKIAECRQ